eukprot:2903053-Pyramimonas_sp.AAC.1
MAECAAEAAVNKPVGFAWELLSEAWRVFSHGLEVELEGSLGVNIRKTCLKGVPPRPSWCPIVAAPKSACAELAHQGWVWLAQLCSETTG